jgi:hypothetical protein
VAAVEVVWGVVEKRAVGVVEAVGVGVERVVAQRMAVEAWIVGGLGDISIGMEVAAVEIVSIVGMGLN